MRKRTCGNCKCFDVCYAYVDEERKIRGKFYVIRCMNGCTGEIIKDERIMTKEEENMAARGICRNYRNHINGLRICPSGGEERSLITMGLCGSCRSDLLEKKVCPFNHIIGDDYGEFTNDCDMCNFEINKACADKFMSGDKKLEEHKELLSNKETTLNKPEPMPTKNENPAVWDLVLKDIKERDEIGAKKYGTRLQPFNGRDCLVDAYQESLDLVVYLRQAIFEIENGATEATKKIFDDFDVYQNEAAKFAIYPTLGHSIVYPALGLAGEAGEVVEKVKKAMRDDGVVITPERREQLKKELGDVLWNLSEVARRSGLLLSEIATSNIQKLSERVENNTLQGEGDDR